MFLEILLFLSAIFYLATTGIAIQCYDKSQDLKQEKPSNYNFLIISIAFAVMQLLAAGYMIYRSFRPAYPIPSAPPAYI